MTSILIKRPKLDGRIIYSPFYQPLDNLNSTFTVLLIGHADATRMYEPYDVRSMKEAIEFLGGDSESPLLRSLLECYNSGCRSIKLFAVAPMAEYVRDVSDRNTVKAELDNQTFYELYHSRLQSAYDIIGEYENFHYIVPVEASFCDNGDIDFITPLASLCKYLFEYSSTATVGILGTRSSAYNQDLYDDMVGQVNSISVPSPDSNHVMLIAGEGPVSNKQMTQTYVGNYATQLAGLMSSMPVKRSVVGLNFRGIVGLAGFDLNETQQSQLISAKINPVVRTQRGKRNVSFETKLITDNTLSGPSSQFWSMNQTRLVNYVVDRIKSVSKNYIGTVETYSLELEIKDFMITIKKADYIRDYQLKIKSEPYNNTLTIDVGLKPYSSIKFIYFSVETGPGL